MKIFPVVCCLLAGVAGTAGAASITVDASKPGVAIAPTMYGLFFEDINHSADSGLYAEMVRNRGFEDWQPSEGAVRREDGWWISGAGHGMKPDSSNDNHVAWNLVKKDGASASITLDKTVGLNPKTPSSLRLDITKVKGEGAGIANDGYWGMSVKSGAKYDLSFYVKSKDAFTGDIGAYLESADGKIISNLVVIPKEVAADWKQFKGVFTATATDPKAKLVIKANSNSTLWFDMVSLFPQKTFNNRKNGFRPELAQMLADVKPGFMRWPGGCIVEGVSLKNAFDWKDTIGPIEERPGKWNLWGYRRTDGFGYYEFLQLCEDLKCEPLLVVNAGMSCFFRTPEFAPLDKMDKYVQDALDAIEYANGPVDSKWGALRAKAGHPKPFNLKYLEIGNENWGPEYAARYNIIYKAVKEKYPDIITISNAVETGMKMEINDEHYYNKPEFFQMNEKKYDTYDRKGPKVFLGEVACTEGCGKGNLRAALGEAAFLIGAERNADVVQLISYAPLFVNTNDRKWNPDTIVFDSAQAFGTPSYYLYKLFGTNRPDVTLPLTLDAQPINPTFPGKIGVGSIADTTAQFADIRVEKDGKTLFKSNFTRGSDGWQLEGPGKWEVKDGFLIQDSNGKALAGDKNWTDYTLTVKAKKIKGNEGFVIYFSSGAGSSDARWNIGGWGNTRHGMEVPGAPEDGKPGKIEDNRWYDIKIEVKGTSIKAYLDGQLIHDINRQVTSIFAVAGKENKTGDIIIKVSNPTGDAYKVDMKLNGAGNVASTGTETILTSADPWDENSFENPTKVAPVTKQVSGLGSSFNYTFKPYSLTILRLKTK